MQRQLENNKYAQWGLFLIVLGVAVPLLVKLALFLGHLLMPLAGWAIFIGIVLLIVGLVSPGRRRY